MNISRISAILLLAAGPLINAAPASAGPPETYKVRCAMCHQSDAAGLPGQFPRLAGRVGTIAGSPEGRHYLMIELLNGMYGTVQVDGKAIQGMMPTMRSMKDGEIADVLNHLTRLKPPPKKIAPFTPAEVARVRAEPMLNGAAVAAERSRLVAAGKIP